MKGLNWTFLPSKASKGGSRVLNNTVYMCSLPSMRHQEAGQNSCKTLPHPSFYMKCFLNSVLRDQCIANWNVTCVSYGELQLERLPKSSIKLNNPNLNIVMLCTSQCDSQGGAQAMQGILTAFWHPTQGVMTMVFRPRGCFIWRFPPPGG